MRAAGVDDGAAASLLVRRQASFDRQHAPARAGSFSATVVNRFFSDNSLGRQKRLLETTRRRQARAREKALEQEHRLEKLQLELEETMRLKALREERELARMERKLQHAAATYIQYAWRKHRYFAKLRAKRDHAARCILAARWLRSLLERRRRQATAVLQRAWRAQLSKKKVARCSKAYRHLKELEKLERNAKVLQRALAKRAAFCRLIRSSEFARYPLVMAATEKCVDSQSELQESRRALGECVATGKHLASQEALLASDIESLQARLRESKAKLEQEQAKLERFHALDAHRRTKGDAEILLRLQELEVQMRRDVRMELEKELEASRRAQVREKSKQQQLKQPPRDDPFAASAFESRYRMRKPSASSSSASGSELRAARPADSEERHE